MMLGGAGNVIANLRALESATSIVCRVGNDAEGATVRQLLAEANAEVLAVGSDTVPTIQKTRFVAKGHHVLRMDRETIAAPDEAEEAELIVGSHARSREELEQWIKDGVLADEPRADPQG